MKKFLLTILIMGLLVASPFTAILIYGAYQESVYQETFYAELPDKIERLKNTEEKKIVFIGGSSLIFGLRSEEIAKATGYEVVDFGLYAAIGTIPMMRLASDYINENDIVILAPEINTQTYSDYIGYSALHKCFEDYKYPLTDFALEENVEFFFHDFPFIFERDGVEVTLEEPYTKSSFNEYGDIDSEVVKNNIMGDSYYDEGQPITFGDELLDKSFIKEVNRFYRKMNRKGAKMYFSLSPSNALAVDSKGLAKFEKSLKEKLDCPILGDVNTFTYHQYYFYDTNFHLNRAGSYLHSKTLSELLRVELSIDNEYVIDVPSMPKPAYYSTGETVVVDDITYAESYLNGAFSYTLTAFGVSKKNITEFRIPETINGAPVNLIGLHAFKDMPNLEKVTIPSTVTMLYESPFENCPNMVGLYLEHSMPIPVRESGLLDGCASTCKIYIKADYYRRFMSDYTWVNYRSVMETY